nr:MAG TPA: hypothetical protein [Caudoviricetes sp.]
MVADDSLLHFFLPKGRMETLSQEAFAENLISEG